MEISVLYESKWLLAINKPAGLLVEHSAYYPSVEDWAKSYIAKQEKQPFVGIVHRLDRAVSGVLMIAKRKAALQNLHEQFRERQVQKTYLTLVEKMPPDENGMLTHWLRKDLPSIKAFIFDKPTENTQECRLSYRVVEKKSIGILMEIDLHTGKFHQIRAQLAHIGCPILGDIKYGSTVSYQPDAIALHAWRLRVAEPMNGEILTIEAPIPF
ncbi:MAG: RluA family pseudouridine synthase [Saprospiraceae bacterium]|nr:RluA family pseudouridine synthase [Saprospiraceae bacterium]